MSTKLKLPCGTTGFFNDRNEWVCTGSQMGRRNVLPDDREVPVKLRLTKLRSVDGDYDQWGAYWGNNGIPVWCAWGEDAEIQIFVFVRATCRELAKLEVRQQLPSATFYR